MTIPKNIASNSNVVKMTILKSQKIIKFLLKARLNLIVWIYLEIFIDRFNDKNVLESAKVKNKLKKIKIYNNVPMILQNKGEVS